MGVNKLMTKQAALQFFFSGFGMPAYPANNVPEDTIFPWLTYEAPTGFFGDEASSQVNIWYHTESEAIPNAKAEEIGKAIGQSGICLSCDDGWIWIKRGSPWCTPLNDETDQNIKRRMLNITLEYLTVE